MIGLGNEASTGTNFDVAMNPTHVGVWKNVVWRDNMRSVIPKPPTFVRLGGLEVVPFNRRR